MKKFFSEINWGNVLLIAVVATVAAVFIVPLARPWLQKIPVLGKYAE
jgi:hypothetical protein